MTEARRMRKAGALEVRMVRTKSSISDEFISMLAAPVSMQRDSKYPNVFT
jgi:hypothetical protein